jgi:hypothetical protein
MKYRVTTFLVLFFAGSLQAQQSVTIKEPAAQCYQDLKVNLPEAVRWDDKQMTVTSKPLVTLTTGNVQVVARVFQEQNDTACKIVVAFDAPTESAAWNAENDSRLFQNAHMLKARIESTMNARDEKGKE